MVGDLTEHSRLFEDLALLFVHGNVRTVTQSTEQDGSGQEKRV
jgi:hypothetical protein